MLRGQAQAPQEVAPGRSNRMAFTLRTGARGRVPSASRSARRVATPRLEVLEDRAWPSGGSALSTVLGELKPAAAPRVSDMKLTVPGSFRADDTAPKAGPGGIPLAELFSGYPLPPALGPGLTGDM